nr:unnamed protein product [Callosobruchus chinensis]
MPTRAACKCCNQLFETHLLLTCCVCKDRYNHSCVSITANEVRTLNANKGYDWSCLGCRAVGKDIKGLTALIIQLQNDIKDLKAENARAADSSRFSFEDVVSEVIERQKRKNNIILFNIKEPNQNMSVNERSDSDTNAVIEIVNKIDPAISLSNIKPVRLGVFSDTKIRPVKVTLENSDLVKKITINSKKLSTSRTYSNVRISSDRTKRQMDYYKQVKRELMERQSTGDTNCRIRYFNDVPRIVQVN